ncbi:LANO_0H12794g1_1 [Lachancea nothofagi CBS 11611]|uniref:Sugar phosphate phosphatase n=1 Tax=Lachancea nothofagi CBS 11611 TaxID=1266666 RepID=A0A1G4KMM9_9SACH|nr:LANO_0H12794g1_1 [Lachancea nothofagi CBS 11611]
MPERRVTPSSESSKVARPNFLKMRSPSKAISSLHLNRSSLASQYLHAMALPETFKNNDQDTFGAYTAHSRWPTIIGNAINDLQAELDTLDSSTSHYRDGTLIQNELASLRDEIKADKPIRPFTSKETEVGQVPGSFNEVILAGHQTWLTGGWLFCEVYLYRRVNVMFRAYKSWASFDIFNKVKQSTFQSSMVGVVELAARYQKLEHQLGLADAETLEILFKEFVEISLWGNATDLSLLTNATLEDIKSLQGEAARKASESKILINHTSKAWNQLKSSQHKRVDFVLDNSGFEVYADLMLALFLLDTGIAKQCVLHAKDIPYMVSDCMIKDFELLLQDMQSSDFFDLKQLKDEEQSGRESLDFLVKTLKQHVQSGQLTFTQDTFWALDLDYSHIDPSETKYHGAQIHQELLQSDLVIFKGDLNYRKLTGDRKWARTTKWETAIGPLASNGLKTLSLRTCKADVVVGLEPGVDEKLCSEWTSVKKTEPGSWWASSGKYAVICFCDGQS